MLSISQLRILNFLKINGPQSPKNIGLAAGNYAQRAVLYGEDIPSPYQCASRGYHLCVLLIRLNLVERTRYRDSNDSKPSYWITEKGREVHNQEHHRLAAASAKGHTPLTQEVS